MSPLSPPIRVHLIKTQRENSYHWWSGLLWRVYHPSQQWLFVVFYLGFHELFWTSLFPSEPLLASFSQEAKQLTNNTTHFTFFFAVGFALSSFGMKFYGAWPKVWVTTVERCWTLALWNKNPPRNHIRNQDLSLTKRCTTFCRSQFEELFTVGIFLFARVRRKQFSIFRKVIWTKILHLLWKKQSMVIDFLCHLASSGLWSGCFLWLAGITGEVKFWSLQQVFQLAWREISSSCCR